MMSLSSIINHSSNPPTPTRLMWRPAAPFCPRYSQRVRREYIPPAATKISASQWTGLISIPQAQVQERPAPKSGPPRLVLWNGSPVEAERLSHILVGGIEPGGEIFVLEGTAEPRRIFRRGGEPSDRVLGARATVQ